MADPLDETVAGSPLGASTASAILDESVLSEALASELDTSVKEIPGLTTVGPLQLADSQSSDGDQKPGTARSIIRTSSSHGHSTASMPNRKRSVSFSKKQDVAPLFQISATEDGLDGTPPSPLSSSVASSLPASPPGAGLRAAAPTQVSSPPASPVQSSPQGSPIKPESPSTKTEDLGSPGSVRVDLGESVQSVQSLPPHPAPHKASPPSASSPAPSKTPFMGRVLSALEGLSQTSNAEPDPDSQPLTDSMVALKMEHASSLQSELDRRAVTLQKSEDEVIQLQTELSAQRIQLETQAEANATRAKQLEVKAQALDEQESTREAKEKAVADREASVQESDRSAAEKVTRLHDLEKRLLEQQQELSDKEASTAEQLCQATALQADAAELETRAKQEADAIQRSLAQLEGERSIHSAKAEELDKRQANINQWEQTMVQSESVLDGRKKLLEERQKDMDDRFSKLLKWESDLAAMEQKFKEKADDLNKAEASLNGAKTALDKRESELNQWTTDLGSREEALEAKTQEVASRDQALLPHEQNMARAQQALEARERSLEERTEAALQKRHELEGAAREFVRHRRELALILDRERKLERQRILHHPLQGNMPGQSAKGPRTFQSLYAKDSKTSSHAQSSGSTQKAPKASRKSALPKPVSEEERDLQIGVTKLAAVFARVVRSLGLASMQLPDPVTDQLSSHHDTKPEASAASDQSSQLWAEAKRSVHHVLHMENFLQLVTLSLQQLETGCPLLATPDSANFESLRAWWGDQASLLLAHTRTAVLQERQRYFKTAASALGKLSPSHPELQATSAMLDPPSTPPAAATRSPVRKCATGTGQAQPGKKKGMSVSLENVVKASGPDDTDGQTTPQMHAQRPH
eukprot:gene4723-859_t